MSKITYHIATSDDMDGFLHLQEQNLVSRLAPEQQADGFVTTPFSNEQLTQLIHDEGLFVAKDGAKIVAYVAAAGWEYYSEWPIFAYMASLLPEITFCDQRMDAQHSYQYGPICIDANYRGQGIFEKIFAFARHGMAHRYPFALTFINARNGRSYAAHQRISDIEFVYEFTFNDQTYRVLAFETEPNAPLKQFI